MRKVALVALDLVFLGFVFFVLLPSESQSMYVCFRCLLVSAILGLGEGVRGRRKPEFRIMFMLVPLQFIVVMAVFLFLFRFQLSLADMVSALILIGAIVEGGMVSRSFVGSLKYGWVGVGLL